MVTPLPSAHSHIGFSYFHPLSYPGKSGLFRKEQDKTELYKAVCNISHAIGFLHSVQIDFCNGAVELIGESKSLSKKIRRLVLDVVSTKFFLDHEEYIKDINPSFSVHLQDNVLTKEIKKISAIFYDLFRRYLDEQTNDNGELDPFVENTTIVGLQPGFKNFHHYAYEKNKIVTAFETLEGRAGDKFKQSIKKVPTSLLNTHDSIKLAPFLQAGLDQKDFYAEKLLYLRQVLFLLIFQDSFKDLLQVMKKNLSLIEYRPSALSINDDHELKHNEQIEKRLQLIQSTLSKFPIQDGIILISLACRSSLDDLKEYDNFFENSSILETEYIKREAGNARRADLILRQILRDSFSIVPKKFSLTNSHQSDLREMESIESYLMGISGLAISPGLKGRLAMRNHHTVYYQSRSRFHIPNVSDHFLVEFLMSAAQFYVAEKHDWIEQVCLGYLIEMMGQISLDELNMIKSKIHQIGQAVERAPVHTLLKEKSTHYVLRNRGITQLQSLYKIAREEVGLASLDETHSLSCLIV